VFGKRNSIGGVADAQQSKKRPHRATDDDQHGANDDADDDNAGVRPSVSNDENDDDDEGDGARANDARNSSSVIARKHVDTRPFHKVLLISGPPGLGKVQTLWWRRC
jgi:hypothetical protein